MTSRRLHIAIPPRLRVLRIGLACLFLFVQSFSFAHAAEYSSAPHEHNGVACDIAVLAPDVDVLEPPAFVFAPPLPRAAVPTLYFTACAAVVSLPACRAPPARGPPLLK